MNLRAILVKVWQGKPLEIQEIVFLLNRVDSATLAEILEFVKTHDTTVTEAEKELIRHVVVC